MIVKTALNSSNKIDTILIGEDTDLLVLLCYHFRQEPFGVFLMSEPKQSTTHQIKIWNIRALTETLGPAVCSHMLFLHALLGCDTTSRIYGSGKATALKKAMTNEHFRKQAQVFESATPTVEELVTAGEQAIVYVHGGNIGENLDDLLYKRFIEKVASSAAYVQGKNLPPTSAAAHYHSLRIYYQIQQWKGFEKTFKATDWGWSVKDNCHVPKMTDLQAAPAHLLSVIRCNCKKNSNSLRCICRKNGQRLKVTFTGK